MTDARSLGLDRPRGARGLLPLLMGAYAIGKGIYGAVNANQVKQRNKGYIEDAYRGASQRQQVHANDVRQETAESLNRRGLLTPGAQFAQTSPSLTESAYTGGTPTTLGGQQQADTNRELALEQHDLEAAHSRALNENKADYLNNLVGAATGTAQGIMSAYSAGQTLNATHQLGAPPAAAPAATRVMSGGADETPLIHGAFGLDPLSAKPQGTLNGFGQNNSTFHLGG